MIKQYRKKPVVIEAMKFTADNYNALQIFMPKNTPVMYDIAGRTHINIETLEGTMTAAEGDYIIKGVYGEVYPCKPDIFEATYELVSKLEATRDENMSFGEAIEAMLGGCRIARKAWNGKDMFVAYRKGYPSGIPCDKETAKAFGYKEGDMFICRPYMQMRCADGTHQMWLASQSDILATDWYLV